jgi:hypothetical protein
MAWTYILAGGNSSAGVNASDYGLGGTSGGKNYYHSATTNKYIYFDGVWLIGATLGSASGLYANSNTSEGNDPPLTTDNAWGQFNGGTPVPTVTRTAAGYTISGAVSGPDKSGVTITCTASGQTTQTATTASDGTYTSPALANATWTVTATKTGYSYSGPLTVTVNGANVTGANFGETFSISGTVSGSGQAGATVILQQSGSTVATTTTASGGTYAFAGVANGSYTLVVSQTNYSYTPASLSVSVSGANVAGENFSTLWTGVGTAVCVGGVLASGGAVRPGGVPAAQAAAGVVAAGWRIVTDAGGGATWAAAGGSGSPLIGGQAGAQMQAAVTAGGLCQYLASAAVAAWGAVSALGGRLLGGGAGAASGAGAGGRGIGVRGGAGQAAAQALASGGGTRLATAQCGAGAGSGVRAAGTAVRCAAAAAAITAAVLVQGVLQALQAASSLVLLASGRLARSRLASSVRLALAPPMLATRLAPRHMLAQNRGGSTAMNYLGTKEKTPDEIVPQRWGVDFAPNLIAGESLSSARIVVRDQSSLEDVTAAMVAGDPVIAGTLVTATFQGGVSDRTYAVALEVTTSGGAVSEEAFLIAVRTPPGL